MIDAQIPRVKYYNEVCFVTLSCKQTEELANTFLQRHRIRRLSENTVTAYAYDLVSLFRWLISKRSDVFTFTRQDLFEYIQEQTDRRANPRSINRRLIVCELFLRFLRERSVSIHSSHNIRVVDTYQSSNRGPWPKQRGNTRLRVKVPHTIVEPLQTQAVNQLLTDVRHYRDLGIILLMVLVGLRRNEVLTIGIGDIDFENRIIRIKGKGGKERAMPLPPTLMRVLHKYLEFERPRSAQSAVMFVVLQGPRRGEAMTSSGLRSFFRKKRMRPQIANANPHRLRHTFAYNMVKEGVSIAVLQKMLGHARYATTLQYVALRVEDIADQFFKAIAVIEARHPIQEIPK